MASSEREFTVPGIPKAKGRPRFFRRGTHVGTYTDKASAAFEDSVAFHAQAAGITLMEGPVRISITAIWPMKGQPRKTSPRPSIWKPTRPDLDNVIKSICDGLNGIAFQDDSQVCVVIARKVHAAQGEGARTIVKLEEIEEGVSG